jgi:hypothetical protein
MPASDLLHACAAAAETIICESTSIICITFGDAQQECLLRPSARDVPRSALGDAEEVVEDRVKWRRQMRKHHLKASETQISDSSTCTRVNIVKDLMSSRCEWKNSSRDHSGVGKNSP